MSTLWQKPALHFLVLGSALFALLQWQQWQNSYQITAPTKEILDIQLEEWWAATSTTPTASQIASIKQSLIDDRILLEEALRKKHHLYDPVIHQRLIRDAEFLGISGSNTEKINIALDLGLHKDDEVIRRRLIQFMEEYARSSAKPKPADHADLIAAYNDTPEQWEVPARLAFSHIFFSADKPDSRARAATAKQALETSHASGKSIPLKSAIALGDVFLLGHHLPSQSLDKIQQNFGTQFAIALEQYLPRENTPPSSTWLGPIASIYGQHLLLIQDYHPPRKQRLDEVRTILEERYARQLSDQALQEYLQNLRKKYRVIEP